MGQPASSRRALERLTHLATAASRGEFLELCSNN
jgi:hypothetical protein